MKITPKLKFKMEIVLERLLEYRPKVSLTFISKGRVVKVAFADIIRISQRGSVCIIWTRESKIETGSNLQELMRELPVNDFFQVHACHIVCLNSINRIFEKKIQVDKVFIHFTDYYRKLMKDHLKIVLDSCCELYDNSND